MYIYNYIYGLCFFLIRDYLYIYIDVEYYMRMCYVCVTISLPIQMMSGLPHDEDGWVLKKESKTHSFKTTVLP